MKFKFCILIPLLLLGLMSSAEENKTLKIVYLDGQEAAHALSVIGRIEFSEDSLFLVSNEGAVLGREHRDVVQKLVFVTDDTPSAITEVKTNLSVQIYPNPVLQTLTVKGAKVNETIRIYSLNGNLMSSSIVYDEQTIMDVSGLPVGQYILQVNTQVMKLIKQ